MTACVNSNQKREGARRAVGATLAGVLAVGMVPAAAFADDADEAAAEDEGIETLATDANAFKAGTVAYESGASGDELTYDGTAQGLVPTSVTPKNGSAVEVEGLYPAKAERKTDKVYYAYVDLDATTTNSDFAGLKVGNKALTGDYVTDASGNMTVPTAVGNYAVVTFTYTGDPTSSAAGSQSKVFCDEVATFKIVGQSLEGATLYEKDNGVDDTTFNYDGSKTGLAVSTWKDKLGVALDGVALDDGDYTISIYKVGGSVAISSGDLEVGTEYIVKITGTNGSAYKGQSAEAKLTIGKLDLSTAVIVPATKLVQPSNATVSATDLVISINGVAASDLDADILFAFVSDPKGSSISSGEKGSYTFKAYAKDKSENVEGEQEFQVIYADSRASISFGNDDLYNSTDKVYEVDLSEDEVSYFDASDIKVTYVDGSNATKTLKSSQYTVTYTDADGSEATADDIKTPGTWYVKVDVNTKVDGKIIAGSDVAKVVVSYTAPAKATEVFVSYDGKNIAENGSATYDGTDLSEKLSFLVESGAATLIEGTDYEVVITKEDAAGKDVAVDGIVDAGTYTITVKGLTYEGKESFTFTVNPVEVASAAVVNTFTTATGGFLPYTGEAIEASFAFEDAKGKAIDVPADAYVVEYFAVDKDGKVSKKATDLKEVGTYQAVIKAAEGTVNYDFGEDGMTATVVVSDAKVFLDVPNTGEWYSQVVYDAANLGYINGYSGTKLFGPNDSITRGQVACVLFNMAGGNDRYSDDDFSYTETYGYETGFSDVDGTQYYAKAIAWAANAGVVNGYGDGTFEPDSYITREEMAAMLANYAKAMGDDMAVDSKTVLAEFPDGGQVSDWATEVVAWAAANEIMGNGGVLNPSATITRAEVAAMAVNYQPDGTPDTLI